MSSRRTRSLLALSAAGLVLSSSSAIAVTFIGLGSLSEYPERAFSSANGVSADGSVVVGITASADGSRSEGFRWNIRDGMVGLGGVDGQESNALAVSGDGTVVVGFGMGASGPYRPVVWEGNGGPMVLPGASPYSHDRAYDVSADGSVIVGQVNNQPYLWDSRNGMSIPIGLNGSGDAYAVSDDGSTVVGDRISPGLVIEAFRWDALHGTLMLGDLPGGNVYSFASGISADKSVVVGSGYSTGIQAFRWDATNGMVGLGPLPSGPDPNQGYSSQSQAYGVSSDGAIVVGYYGYWDTSTTLSHAVIWDRENRMSDLNVLLPALGVDLSGWTLTSAQAISADGQTIVGHGVNPAGVFEAWIAVIPEPSTALLMFFGLVGLGWRR